jgi:hypothetical protein
MEANQIQQSFFQHLKNQLPPHLSLVDEVAGLLSISNDSAYRRIRGEKQISFEEIQKLCSHYKLSMDQFLHLKSDSFIFNGRITNDSDFNYNKWLDQDLQHLNAIRNAPFKHLYVLAKEIPFLYYFLVPEIFLFKSYFFTKTILLYEQMRGVKFSLEGDYEQMIEQSRKISAAYAQIPSSEIWHVENITSTLRQIEFFMQTGNFKSAKDAFCILDKMDELINHIERQAETGLKFTYNQNPSSQSVPVKMYINELIWGDNMIYIDYGSSGMTYINHSVMNFITTRDEMFNNYSKKTIETVIAKSTLISEVNEKDRLMFFNRLRAKINSTRLEISK